MKKITFLLVLIFIVSCSTKEQADLIITNAKVYTVNNNFETVEAFAVKDGKFIDTGSTQELLEKFEAADVMDANGQTIVPGLIDAHCHFYNLGLHQLNDSKNRRGNAPFNNTKCAFFKINIFSVVNRISVVVISARNERVGH